MTYPTWESGAPPSDELGNPLSLEGFPKPRWAHLLHVLPLCASVLTVALLCVGADGGCAGLQQQGWVPGTHYQPKYVMDTCGYLRTVAWNLHGSMAAGFRLGAIDGDILTEDIAQWDVVDGVLSGPPCPPWSLIGAKGGENDVRALVFRRVTDIIIDQG